MARGKVFPGNAIDWSVGFTALIPDSKSWDDFAREFIERFPECDRPPVPNTVRGWVKQRPAERQISAGGAIGIDSMGTPSQVHHNDMHSVVEAILGRWDRPSSVTWHVPEAARFPPMKDAKEDALWADLRQHMGDIELWGLIADYTDKLHDLDHGLEQVILDAKRLAGEMGYGESVDADERTTRALEPALFDISRHDLQWPEGPRLRRYNVNLANSIRQLPSVRIAWDLGQQIIELAKRVEFELADLAATRLYTGKCGHCPVNATE